MNYGMQLGYTFSPEDPFYKWFYFFATLLLNQHTCSSCPKTVRMRWIFERHRKTFRSWDVSKASLETQKSAGALAQSRTIVRVAP
jgi:hypothetical protein